MPHTYIYGTHAVEAALGKRPDVVTAVHAREELLKDPKFLSRAKRAGDVMVLDEKKLPHGVPREASHQGVIAAIDTDKLLVPFKTFKQQLAVTNDTVLVMLGEVQDPHNVGAIIRSAAAFGATAVLIPEHRQAPITGTVIKVSAGMVFSIPLVSVGNVNNALDTLKEAGFWTYGLAGDGETPVTSEAFTRPSIFVIGNEGSGMRAKTREHCDTVLSIPMHPRAESLNASVSAATVLYAWSVQHPNAVRGN